MRVWVETLAKERSIKADPIVKVFTNVESLGQALRERGVDGVVLPIDQFWVLGGSAVFNRCIFPMRGGDLSETYVLLVHAESGISQIEQLKGRSCTVLDHSRMALANAWLSVLLAKKGLGLPSECFAQLSSFNKLSKVVLPVFFRQTDACLVTSQGFKTMTELNPQLGKALRVVISSPAIIPTGFFFRKGDELESQSRMVTELSRIHSTPAGQQVLTVFQTDRLEEKPLSCLDDSLRILAEFDGLAGRAAGSQSAELVVRPGPAGEGTR